MNTWFLQSLGKRNRLSSVVALSGFSNIKPTAAATHKEDINHHDDWYYLVKPRLANRKRRLYHLLWNEVRCSWHYLDENKKKRIAELGWAPTRPSRLHEDESVVRFPCFLNNGSGEDFLFFSRKMVNTVDQWLEKNGKQIHTWSSEKGDTTPYPLSSEQLVRRMETIKIDYRYWGALVREYDLFRDSERLSQMTLAELGCYLERVIDKMQLRWATVPWQGGRADNTIDPRWDCEDNDWLADQYSAHVNKVFWSLRKWVDCRVNDWYTVCSDRLEKIMLDGVPWFVDKEKTGRLVIAKKPWTGSQKVSFDESDQGLLEMEAVFSILHENKLES